MTTISDYEMRVLRHLNKGRGLKLGRGKVAPAAAARRLEKKGLAGQSPKWFITRAGETFIKNAVICHPGMWTATA